jgi:hypothetical protein
MTDWLKRAWREGTKRVSWLAVILPWAFFVALFWAKLCNHIDLPGKPALEAVALVILYAAVVTAGVRYWKCRELFFAWLTLLCIVFTMREHHFPHTGNGVFIATGILAIYAWFARARLAVFLDARRVMSMFMAVLVTYYIAWSLDARMWRRWLPGEKVTTWSPVEEALEVIGHLLLLATVIVCVLWARRQRMLAVDPPPSSSSDSTARAVA